jgi:hypothetical protein
MAKSIEEWLKEGEGLYEAAMGEYRQLEDQIAELKKQRNAKRSEVNQLGRVIGKPQIEAVPSSPNASGHAADGPTVEVIEPGAPGSVPNTRSSIARALAGQPMRR